jgi:hypothetical protein
MGKTRGRGRLAGLVGILTITAAVPACKSPDGSRVLPFTRPSPDSTNTVMRPPYIWPETKPLFLSGYAGSTYDPNVRARPIYSNAPAPVLPSTPSSITVDEGSWNSN